MSKKVVIGLIIVVIVFGLGAWWLASSMPSSSEVPKPETSNEKSTLPDTTAAATITYTDSGFSPATLTVKKDDTIKIVNQSSTSLEFSSDDHPTHKEDPELNMAIILPGKDAMLKVTKTGSWGYHNHLKSSDEGHLTVE